MIGSDAQKHWTLQFRRGLITDGFFAATRNPNYLGEVLIYLSFGLVSQSLISYAILALFWVALFGARMRNKDRSLARKPGFEEYRRRSHLFFPRLLADDRKEGWAWTAAGAVALGGWALLK